MFTDLDALHADDQDYIQPYVDPVAKPVENPVYPLATRGGYVPLRARVIEAESKWDKYKQE